MEHSKNLLPPFSVLGASAAEVASQLCGCTAVVGFDGFLDTITRVVKKTGTDSAKPEYFDSLSDFGAYLAEHKLMNCSLELETCSERFGGNAPLLANALGTLGAVVDCYGTFGESQLHVAFQDLHCRLHSFGKASESLALEFRDGKIFLGRNTVIPQPSWEYVCSSIDGALLREKLLHSDLIALVNWSELEYSHSLWEQAFYQCLAHTGQDKSRYAFFDLCDIARKSDDQVLRVLELTSLYSEKRYAVLSLNKNEALRVGDCIGAGRSIPDICKLLMERYSLDEVIVHTREGNTLNIRGKEPCCCATVPVANPAVLTGAGDHFNAAYCAALLVKAAPAARLRFATEFATHYIKTGQIPTDNR